MNIRSVTTILVGAILSSPLVAGAADRKDADLALTEAGTAIEAAERSDASQYATTEISIAHDMLMNAQTAYDHRDWIDCVFNSANAKVDANLAAARSRQHRAEAATAELETTLRSLREQLGIMGERP